MSKKDKLLQKLIGRPADLGWDEACVLMKQCGFKLHNRSGSARMFRHTVTKQKVSLHEPHGGDPLKEYAVDILIEALQNAGEIDS